MRRVGDRELQGMRCSIGRTILHLCWLQYEVVTIHGLWLPASVLWQYDQGCSAVEGGHLDAIRHLFCAVRCSAQYCYGVGFLLREWHACCCGWYSLLSAKIEYGRL